MSHARHDKPGNAIVIHSMIHVPSQVIYIDDGNVELRVVSTDIVTGTLLVESQTNAPLGERKTVNLPGMPVGTLVSDSSSGGDRSCYGVALCTISHSVALCRTVLHCAALYCTVLHGAQRRQPRARILDTGWEHHHCT